MRKNFRTTVKITKVHEKLGLVFGWAIICKVHGEEHFDLQDDHIPEDSMLEAATDFMLNSRMNGDMHVRKEAGTILFAWPMTTEIAKIFDVKTDQTGLMIAAKPDPTQMAKFISGELTGFSIGGHRIEDVPVEEED